MCDSVRPALLILTGLTKNLISYHNVIAYFILTKSKSVSVRYLLLLIYSETRVTWSVKQLLGFRHLRSPKVPAAGSELPPLRVPLPAAALRRARARRGYRPRPGGCGGAATAARW